MPPPASVAPGCPGRTAAPPGSSRDNAGSSCWSSSPATISTIAPWSRWAAASAQSSCSDASSWATTRPPFFSNSKPSPARAPRSPHRSMPRSAKSSSGPGNLSDTSRSPSPDELVPAAGPERSTTMTSSPELARRAAIAVPTMPAPTTTTSATRGRCPDDGGPGLERASLRCRAPAGTRPGRGRPGRACSWPAR